MPKKPHTVLSNATPRDADRIIRRLGQWGLWVGKATATGGPTGYTTEQNHRAGLVGICATPSVAREILKKGRP